MYNSLALDDNKDVNEEVRMLSALCKWSGVVHVQQCIWDM